MATNLLFSFAGRKSYLIPLFRRVAGVGTLVAVDADPKANIRHYADRFHIAPLVTEAEAYIARLVALVEEYGIHAVLPQNDLELIPLAAARSRFAARGARVMGVSAEIAGVLADKVKACQWLRMNGFASPGTRVWDGVPPEDWPVVVKARSGQASQGLAICHRPEDLHGLHGDLVLQDFVAGDEYNLDILATAAGHVVAVVPKKKIAMYQGSTDKAVGVHSRDMIELGVALGEALGHLGSVDVDLILGPDGPAIIDINPRIGGGFPYTAVYCPRYLTALTAICRGEEPRPFLGEFTAGLEVHRELRFIPLSHRERPHHE